MLVYLSVGLVTGTPLVLGAVAIFRGRHEDIPAILSALARWAASKGMPTGLHANAADSQIRRSTAQFGSRFR